MFLPRKVLSYNRAGGKEEGRKRKEEERSRKRKEEEREMEEKDVGRERKERVKGRRGGERRRGERRERSHMIMAWSLLGLVCKWQPSEQRLLPVCPFKATLGRHVFLSASQLL